MNSLYKSIAMLALLGGLASCNDFLDKEPLSEITPEAFFTDDSQLGAYVNNLYPSVLPSNGGWDFGIFGIDANTDNQVGEVYDDKYVKGKLRVPHSEDKDWNFTNINNINYVISEVEPKFESGAYSSNAAKHYLGEAYFLRAYDYFKRYQMFGDFPIIKTPLQDNLETLKAASVRQPRNMVARFIIEDLEKAIELLGHTDMATTRINKKTALLLKSRVGLFEGTWLKNFAGTAFVPGTSEWPGTAVNGSFKYEAGSIEAESKWFLQKSMEAAKELGDQMIGVLADNTGEVPQTQTTVQDILAANPYMALWSAENMSSYPEVLLWRQYDKGLGITHNVNTYTHQGNWGLGLTRGLVESYVMKNGLPIYADGSGYHGDQTIADVRKDRDPRLFVFLKENGQKNLLIPHPEGDHAVPVEAYPKIFETDTRRYVTGYCMRKGWSGDGVQCGSGTNYTGCLIFRGVEALLNYIEASYELNGSLDGTAKQYWTAIRARHHMDTDFQKTISATDMAQEAKGDWGAYTAGQVLTDATLYNIRRERRCELMAEGLRWMDLCRWRAMDQMTTQPYHIEGMHIWNTPMESWYDAKDLAEKVSSKSRSEYIRPYEIKTNSEVYDGLVWTMAHYLKPIMYKQFLLTSEDGSSVETSDLYQNPYWPVEADQPATK